MSLQRLPVRALRVPRGLLPRQAIALVQPWARGLKTVSRVSATSPRTKAASARPYELNAISRAVSTATDAATPPKPWTAPEDVDSRPVVIIGAGVIGRRLAVMWASTGRPVILHDIDTDALSAATAYIADTLATLCAERDTHPGRVMTTTVLGEACTAHPWMVIEAVPENHDLKTEILGTVDQLVPDDCLIASNSSTWGTSWLKSQVNNPDRLLSTHYYIPPRNTYVELMSSGSTNPQIFPFLAEQMRTVGLAPLILPRESPGFIFYRIWAAIKSETLKVLSEGLAEPKDVDALFRDFFHAEKGPCEKMDEVGLHTVLQVEKHLANMGLVHEGDRRSLRWLEDNYVGKHHLGEKTGSGLFSEEERRELAERQWAEKRLRATKVMEGESKGA